MERKRKIMVVDDHRDTRETVCELLTLLGHDARPAATGADAIELFQSHRPEVVLLDLGLPDMSGHEVALQLRSLNGSKPLFLVAFTGSDVTGLARRSYAAGMDRHLRKPVDLSVLREAIAAAS